MELEVTRIKGRVPLIRHSSHLRNSHNSHTRRIYPSTGNSSAHPDNYLFDIMKLVGK
jgi:hypothetical protein